ncbi:MAG: 16S rRNA (guanine(527)-N(7))-methyltransferase RsmG [Synergistaceae bacterium]|nr:16S rRNA (guanine(527)-N(7))-methyltransferase RsmG [Synergistaceae bacterium]
MNPQRSILYRYAELLSSCKRARLTGTKGADEIYTLQVADCIASVDFVPESGLAVDVGSGGGLPGIVWAVYRPNLKVTLIDSINKKCEAVSEIISSLGIANVEVICSRSEDYARTHREVFDIAGARALSSAGVTAELLSPLVKKGGRIITFKGEKVHDEISQVNDKWNLLGLSKPSLNFYGGEDSSRCVVTWEKVKKCPAMYPRRTGLAGTKFFWE